MFRNKKSDPEVVSPQRDSMQSGNLNLIGNGTTITGEVQSDGDIRIDGLLKGNVSSKAKVVVGPTGTIEGDIHAENVDVSGKVNGRIEAEGILFLKESAQIQGEFQANKLIVESGAALNGNCNMGSAPTETISSSIVEESQASTNQF